MTAETSTSPAPPARPKGAPLTPCCNYSTMKAPHTMYYFVGHKNRLVDNLEIKQIVFSVSASIIDD